MFPFLPLFENKTNWGFPYLKINRFGGFTKFIFHAFDRYEIQIQAFGDIFMENISFVNPHLRKNICEIYTHFIDKKYLETETKS